MMPGYTSNFNLPYPVDTDDPCNFATQWCDFTTAVNAVLDGFQATINRTVPVVPAAGFIATISTTYNSAVTNFLSYDSEPFDTADWIDFDADNTKISIDRSGVFHLNGADIQQPDGGNSTWTLEFVGAGASPNKILDRGVVGQIVGNWNTSLTFSAFPQQVQMLVSGPNSIFTITRAYFSAIWHADTFRES